MRKILYIECGSGYGGSAKSLSLLVRHLDRGRFTPIVACKDAGVHLSRLSGIDLIILRKRWEPGELSYWQTMLYFITNLLPAVLEVHGLIKRYSIDLVHVNTNIFTGIPYILAARFAGVPVVCHVRETRRLVRREKFFARLVQRVIVINRPALAVYGRFIPASKMTLVYNGLDLKDYENITPFGLRSKYKTEDAVLVGLVGRIVRGKGHSEFIQAIAELIKRNVPVKAFIMGAAKGDDTEYAEDVNALVRELRLENDVIFTGWIDDVRNAMSELDILVQATTTFPEGFGLTIIEAMALRKPVVATNIPGPADIVIDGETGFLVTAGDSKAMADKIEFLEKNPEESRRMGEAGRKRVEGLFEIARVARQVEQVYGELF